MSGIKGGDEPDLPEEGEEAGEVVPKPVAPAPPRPVRPRKKPPAAPKKKPRARHENGWFRQTVAWIGLILAVTCAAMLVWDVKIASFQITIPSFWPGTIKPGELVVLIDAGHGGHDSGARSGAVVEKDLNLDVAKRVKKELENQGIRAELTRTNDRFLALHERTGLANQIGNCVFVSIHFNDAKDKNALGVETYYSTEKVRFAENSWVRSVLGFIYQQENREDDSRELAEAIQEALVEATGAPDRGVKDRRLFVVRRTPHPAVLVEGGFISNPEEAKKLADPAYRETLAKAVAAGIVDYLESSQRLHDVRTE